MSDRQGQNLKAISGAIALLKNANFANLRRS